MRRVADENFGISVAVGRNVFSWRPRVSIVIPAYNVAAFIEETLDSVKAQKFRDYEVVVVNDGSPDTPKLERALKQYLQDIIYIKQPSRGAGAARNTAIVRARADIIAFLDGDDVWLPDFLASQVAFLGKGWDMVYADAAMFGMRSAYRQTFMDTAPSDGDVTAASLLDLQCNIITSGTVARKNAILAAGSFEEERNRGHDFHLWLRMLKKGARIGYQKEVLLKYRVHTNNLSGDSISRVEREIEVFERVKRTVDLTSDEVEIVDRRLTGLEADLHVECGKSFLLKRDFRKAHKEFIEANRRRPSLKMSVIAWGSLLAPKLLLNHYRSHRQNDIALVRTS